MKEIRQNFFNIAKFPGCIGALDRTHVRIRSQGAEVEEIFRNCKSYFFLNLRIISNAT